jgi:hypothetical protein
MLRGRGKYKFVTPCLIVSITITLSLGFSFLSFEIVSGSFWYRVRIVLRLCRDRVRRDGGGGGSSVGTVPCDGTVCQQIIGHLPANGCHCGGVSFYCFFIGSLLALAAPFRLSFRGMWTGLCSHRWKNVGMASRLQT